MSRFAHNRRVFYVEEPVFENAQPAVRVFVCPKTGVRVHTPVLPYDLTPEAINEHQRRFLELLLEENRVADYMLWYYTPMSIEFTRALRPKLTIYDCMDELSAFAGAPAGMHSRESELFAHADLVFTGGQSLFESKRKQHEFVYPFPSSVDVVHFSRARSIKKEPEDQAGIPKPRLGYAGVIDERMDLELLREIAALRPDWHFILLGPIAKIDPASLPRAANIHYLGMKPYDDLPAYFAGWDIGILPFALNDSTRFISPTKTPEYLAAGLYVISTPIRDVITPYGDLGLVRIAGGPGDFISAADSLLASPMDVSFRTRVDEFLSKLSWDKTWSEMNMIMEKQFDLRNPRETGPASAATSTAAAKGTSNV